jgi:hypothetical protein
LAALTVLGAGIAVPLLALVALDPAQNAVRLLPVGLAMLLCVTVAAPFGLLIAASCPANWRARWSCWWWSGSRW